MSSGLSTALNILTNWHCTPLQAMSILQIEVDQPFPEDLSNAQRERVCYVHNIHNDLSSVFDDSEEIYGYMTQPNDNPHFAGRTPLELISSGDLTALERVCWHIDSLRPCESVA
ncbi:MbcA/ParS/Xre antitoxin family protein [Amphritea balenae]|nr:MbcA/ParS/Xre antitoxin family protein [Amphritea balenae]GGK75374.1 hypothetical protein GCM10007941_26860 [Amphritea balenae]